MKASVQGMLAVPDAGISPDGEVLFLWKKEAHHFELEVLPNGQSELFYINHHSDEMWEYDYDVATTLPGEVIHQLTPFLLYDN
ncbi:hypothetical protein EYB53_024520 [Candidatus Chloroploca sp. M-50]|uniref:Uncharacterized protein n=1 Tax=Candidatus Chloroploca mongolica TaxID=2528176 RepID=A0ABS4DHI9_9CHLR|nr:hypothetical protein [Candidatus Chloroploca mongolica]MBP1468896.1 hypothetical protein [Candidatus Chloroploca mongolica]